VAAGTKQPEGLGRDQAFVLGSLHAQHGLADDQDTNAAGNDV
jgi:hypothetical protein